MRLRIVTYNILDGGLGREQLIGEVLSHLQPDILVLQELHGPHLLHTLGTALGLQPFFGSGECRCRMGKRRRTLTPQLSQVLRKP